MDGIKKTLKLAQALPLFIFLFLQACAHHPESGTTGVLDSGGKHFLWKVSDSNSYVWVLGSVHFADSSFYPLDSVIENAFDAAEELAVEINVSDDSVSEEVALTSMEQGLLPKGVYLNEILSRALWSSVDSLCSAWNFPVSGILRMRPWFAAMTLSLVAIERAGVDQELGIDVVLLNRAYDAGKVIVALETAEEQISAIADTSESDSLGVFYLEKTMQEISELDSMVSQMMFAWKTGNDSLLRRALNDGEPEDSLQDVLHEKVYTKRNEKMVESIAQFLAEDRNIFVVVGVAHLALEKDNVIDLLKKRGFKIERF